MNYLLDILYKKFRLPLIENYKKKLNNDEIISENYKY
jgi:hypothetical protein